MKDIERFIAGFRTFQKDYFGPEGSPFKLLKQGRSPKTMIIGCSDSRVDPAILTNCSPGDIFTVRNVANLVPAFEENNGLNGVSAALEFAVCNLEVEHIIVLGHSQCGGINALMAGNCGCKAGGFISRWMSIAAPAERKCWLNCRVRIQRSSNELPNRLPFCFPWKICIPSPGSING